jgi:hypothetical protein
MRLWSARRWSASPSTEAVHSAAWRGIQYDPSRGLRARRGHVESWFLKANDPRERRAIWLRWTIWASERTPGRALAETWAVAFDAARGHVATKTSVPFERAHFAPGDIGATVDECTLSSTTARGRVESGGRTIGYDLAIAAPPGEEPLVHFPAQWMYSAAFPAQKIVSLMPNARFEGVIDVGRHRWAVDAWPGMVGHTWGRAHTDEYAWGHCNAWDGAGEDLVLEGFSARARVRGVLLPTLTSLWVRYEGTRYPMNGFASLASNTGSMTPRRWSFRGQGPRIELTGEMWADTEDFVGLFYGNPDGSTVHCLNSKLARAEVTLSIAGRPPKTLRAERAALELATRDPHHGVRMYV